MTDSAGNFGFYHLAWMNAWNWKCAEEWKAAFTVQESPLELSHYTKNISSVIESGCLWSVALTEQADHEELDHGIRLIIEEARPLIEKEGSGFVAILLRMIPELIAARKKRSFITSFYRDNSSQYHFGKYGKYRLSFQTFGKESLSAMRIPASRSDMLLFPIIYDEVRQREIVRSLLGWISNETRRFLTGSYEYARDSRAWIEQGISRDIGQVLLDFLIGFKQSCHQDDNEWRLLVRPVLALGSSAPKMADEDFGFAVPTSFKRHVELRLPSRNQLAGLPLASVSACEDGEAQVDVRALLKSRRYDEMPVNSVPAENCHHHGSSAKLQGLC